MNPEAYLRALYGLASARGRIYGLLGYFFIKHPDEDFISDLFDPRFEEALSELLRQPTITGEIGEGINLMKSFVEERKGGDKSETLRLIAADRARLLHTRGSGRFSLCESAYRSDKSALEVMETYREEGVKLPEGCKEPPDYLGFELDFMRFLCSREAEAWMGGDVDRALELLEKQEKFLREHLDSWIPSFCEAALKRAETSFYKGVLKLVKGFIRQDRLLLEEVLREAGNPRQEA